MPEIGAGVQIPSGSRSLNGWFVVPEPPCRSAVLLFHGIGDRLTYWRRVQGRLAGEGVASLVFHYSGYPGSVGSTNPESLAEDGHSALAWVRANLPAGTPVFVLGFSLGSGLAAQIAADMAPPPSGLILCEAFTSLREAGHRIVRSIPLIAKALPDVWKTHENIRRITLPILIVHSTGDKLFPAAMAHEIYAAGVTSGCRIELQMLAGHAHNAPYLTVPEDYWATILEFMARLSTGE